MDRTDPHRDGHRRRRRVGVAVVGLGGAVATTAAAGVELLRLGLVGHEGLPLSQAEVVDDDGEARPVGEHVDLVAYEDLVFAGWDLNPADLATAAEGHGVLEPHHMAAAAPALAAVRPWPSIGNPDFCRNIDGSHRVVPAGRREQVDALRADLVRFAREAELDATVMVNLASVERSGDPALPVFSSPERFERGLDEDDPAIGPAMLYAYAALREGVPYANFTPSLAVDVPALLELAEVEGVPVAGKDGKTGQTLLKTVVAPGLRSRALHVDGWFSSNILGNRDGEALDDPASLASKLDTKGAVLDQILGYHVEDHVVTISYYRPRGDNKEAWDTIDLVGFLGQTMQLKLNFLARDSILAAPLAIELARLLDLAKRCGERGVQEQLGGFFKAPTPGPDGHPVPHALHVQEQRLLGWLAAAQPAAAPA